MTRTGSTSTPSKGVLHDHDLAAMDAAVSIALASHVAQYHQPAPPAGSWFGLADPWAGIPFGSLPLAPAGQYWPAGGDKGGATFGGFRFANRPAGVNVMVLDGVSNATFDLIDFDAVPEGIYLNNCSNVTIKRLRARNIYGPFTRTTFHSANLIQATNCSNLTIQDLKVVQPATVPAGYTAYGTEDIVSLGGNPGAWGNVLVERFAFDGGAWQSPSGTGFFVGDGASGHDVTLRNGILLNPGQCAIGTGEEGPYTFANIDVWSDKAGTNAAMQVRTAKVTTTNLRINWPGGNIGNAGTAATFAKPVIVL